MRKLSVILLILCYFLVPAAAAQDSDCFDLILEKKSQQFEACYLSIQGDKKLRLSVKKQRLDLLDRLISLRKDKSQRAHLCEEQSVNFLSQYGIKNLVNPSEDMGNELKMFWAIFLDHCPEIKERFQSE